MKKWLAGAVLALMVVLGGVVAQPVWAESVCDSPEGTFDEAVLEAAGCNVTGDDATVVKVIVSLVQVAIAAIGIVTVIVIIVGGVFYVISTGDPGKTKRAKDTILYGIVGLAVAMLAYGVVWFVNLALGS